jgi:hypothetical protein
MYKMNALAIAISINLHLLEEGDTFTIRTTRFDGSHKVLATVTRADFDAVADGNTLEDILSCDADMDWVAERLSKRCKRE